MEGFEPSSQGLEGLHLTVRLHLHVADTIRPVKSVSHWHVPIEYLGTTGRAENRNRTGRCRLGKPTVHLVLPAMQPGHIHIPASLVERVNSGLLPVLRAASFATQWHPRQGCRKRVRLNSEGRVPSSSFTCLSTGLIGRGVVGYPSLHSSR